MSPTLKQEKVWDNISKSWNDFRQKPVSEAIFYSQHWKPGKILDLGCGNCRNLLPFYQSGFQCYGIDFSKEMLKHAKNYAKKHHVKVTLKKADLTKLPFKNNSFDYCVSFASFHHLDTKEKRRKALKEVQRILKKDGVFFLSVWNKLQWRFIFKKKKILIPWRIKDKTYQRHYHLFTFWELEKLLKENQFKIMQAKRFGKNLIYIIEK